MPKKNGVLLEENYPEELRERLSNLLFEINQIIEKDSEEHKEVPLSLVLIGTFSEIPKAEKNVLTLIYPHGANHRTKAKSFFLTLVEEGRRQVEFQKRGFSSE